MVARYDRIESLIYQALQKVEELRKLVDELEAELREELRKLEREIAEVNHVIEMLNTQILASGDERNG